MEGTIGKLCPRLGHVWLRKSAQDTLDSRGARFEPGLLVRKTLMHALNPRSYGSPSPLKPLNHQSPATLSCHSQHLECFVYEKVQAAPLVAAENMESSDSLSALYKRP